MWTLNENIKYWWIRFLSACRTAKRNPILYLCIAKAICCAIEAILGFDGNVKLMKAIYSFKTKSSFWIWAATTKCSAADYFRLLQLYPHVFHSSSTVSFLSFDGCFYGSAALLLLKNALRTLVTGSTPFRTDTHFRNSLEMTFEVT